MAATQVYEQRRDRIEAYFDRTAVKAWEQLTSDAPVSRVRATVREGRDRMRSTLLSWLPEDLHGLRILDAGCGTGALAVEAARRGADVLAIDLSPSLVDVAATPCPRNCGAAAGARFASTSAAATARSVALGSFDHVVAMDSLIHYEPARTPCACWPGWPQRTRGRRWPSPSHRATPLLMAMRAVGRLFPRGDRAPSIVPVARSRAAPHGRAASPAGAWDAGAHPAHQPAASTRRRHWSCSTRQ
jgi:magnesium-protoporphyrin O-methyltransferase